MHNMANVSYYQSLSDYKSKKIKVKLNQAVKMEVKAESSQVLKNVHEDRKYAIQATIVRYVSIPLLRFAF